MSEWQPIETAPDALVMTKIDDANGCRNEAALKRSGNLWFFADGSMYVYYCPTHWRPMTDVERDAVRSRMTQEADALLRRAASI